jgi:hypothetical protein
LSVLEKIVIIKSRLTKEEGGPFEIFCYHGRIIKAIESVAHGIPKKGS